MNSRDSRIAPKFNLTKIFPFFRPPSHDPEESGDDDPDDSHTEDISDLENVYVNSATSENVVKMHRGRFNILPCVTAGNSRPSNNRFVSFL